MADKSFRRQEFSSLVAAGHALSRKASNPDFHIHNNYEIYIFLQGHVNYFVEQSCYQLKRGDILIFNNQEIHTVVNLKNEVYERITIHFEPKWIRNLSTSQTDLLACFQNRPKGVGNLSHMEDEELATWLPIIEQLISCSNDPSYGSDLLTQSYLVQLLVFVNQLYHNSAQSSSGSIPVKVQPVLHYVDRHISEALTLDGIAEALSMDKFYLSHLFKKRRVPPSFNILWLSGSLWPKVCCPGDTVSPKPVRLPDLMTIPILSAPSKKSQDFRRDNIKNNPVSPARFRNPSKWIDLYSPI